MPLTYTCDIVFNFDVTSIIKASGPDIADGSVVVDADSVNTIRYSISSAHSPTDPPYASRTNTTGVFTGLLPGTYIVNARTNDSCKQLITIIVDYTSTWAPRYRLQYGTSNLDSGLSFRIDIEDNKYVGAVEYVVGSPDPTTLTWTNNKADNVFEPVIGSELTINLISPTDGYFDVLDVFDEKRFRATYYQKLNQTIDNGNFTGSLSPWSNIGSQTQSWAWNSNHARVTTPSNFTTTKGLQIPFSGKIDVEYTFQLNFDILQGAGSAGNSTNLLVYLTDDFTLASPDNAEVFNLPIGAGQSQIFTITPTATRAYLVIAAGNNASSSFGRIIDLDIVAISEIGYIQSWQGFIVPQNSDEEYCRDINYGITFTFSDGLADLANKDFSDDSGNVLKGRISILQGIIFCLNKTSLQLDIWETINFKENGMTSTINDSTLTQAYFDPEVYLKDDGTMEDCLTVLSNLAQTFAARITQSNGVWCIDCPTLKTGSTTQTRKFDYQGNFLSGANESYRIMLRRGNAISPKISFKDFGAVKSHQTMYGELDFIFDYSLKPNPSVIAGGDFENEDISNGQLTDWQISQEIPIAVNPTLETVSRDKDTVSKVLQINFDNFFSVASYAGAEPRAIISSKPIHFDFTSAPTLSRVSISFDVFVNSYSQQPYIVFDYQVYFNSVLSGDCYLAYDASVSTNNYSITIGGLAIENVDGKYIRIYLEPGKWTTVTADFIVSALDEGDLQIIFRANGNLQYDFSSVADLQAVPTNGFSDEEANMRAGRDNRRRILDSIYSAGIATVREYILTAGTDIFDGNKAIEPSDQVGIDTYFWKLNKVLTPDANLWAKNVQIDNVVLKYLPEGGNPVAQQESTASLNQKIKNSLDLTFRHGDLPEDSNYKTIMRGWLSLANGTPTSGWLYKAPAPPYSLPISLLEFIKNIYIGQYNRDRWKLSGPTICSGVIPFIDRPIYEVRTGKIYSIVYPSFMGRLPSAQLQMIETLNGVGVIDEGTTPDPNIEPPVSTADFLVADFSSTDFYV